MSDVEADADTLRNIGWGTDEDYGYYGDENEEDTDFVTDKNWRERYGDPLDKEGDEDHLVHGEEAFYAGKSIEDNPHPKGTPQHKAWRGGFLGAAHEEEMRKGDWAREEDEEHHMGMMKHHMGGKRKCPMCGMHHGMFDECPMHGEEDEDEDMIRGQMGAYGQQGAHMGGAKETDNEMDATPEDPEDLDLGDELGDNDEGEKEGPDNEKLDAITDKASEDPDKQGVIRTVKGAHLVYKRQTEDGTYEELWIYNSGTMRDELDVRKAILAGTDIPTDKTSSPDGSQEYEIWSSGNAEILQIKGLPN